MRREWREEEERGVRGEGVGTKEKKAKKRKEKKKKKERKKERNFDLKPRPYRPIRKSMLKGRCYFFNGSVFEEETEETENVSEGVREGEGGGGRLIVRVKNVLNEGEEGG